VRDLKGLITRLSHLAKSVLLSNEQRGSSNVLGIVSMLVAMAFFIAGDAVMKLMSSHLPTGETMFVRGLMACAMIWALAIVTGSTQDMRRHLTRPVAVRTGAEVGAAVFFQNGLSRLPFAEVSAILQINPLMVTAAAALFLGEKVGWRRWTATAIGFCGVLLIIRPGAAAFQWASVLLIVATSFSTLRDLITRRLPQGTPTLLITAFSAVAITVASLGFLLFETWSWPSLTNIAALSVPAVCMLVGQLLVIVSIRSGEVSAVVPFRYSAILWALLLSVLIWGEFPDRTTLLGIAIVSGAGLYTFHREQVRRRQAAIADATTRSS
jgi:drug/metabolite transporter (DMT)-like permease